MTPYERLQTICEQKGTTVTKFCFEIKNSKGNLATWKKGNFSSSDLTVIHERFGVSADWILFGETDSVQIIEPPNYPIIELNELIADQRYVDITRTYAAASSDEVKSFLKGNFIETAKKCGIDTVPIIGY